MKRRFRNWIVAGAVLGATSIGGLVLVEAGTSQSAPAPDTVTVMGPDGREVHGPAAPKGDSQDSPFAEDAPERVAVAIDQTSDAIGYIQKRDYLAVRQILANLAQDSTNAYGAAVQRGAGADELASMEPGVEVVDSAGNHLGWFVLAFTTKRPANIVADGRLTADSPLARTAD
jgi:hypothetical protein